jgi:hypothetical protein
VASEDPENRAADGAPCADSFSTLKEHLKKLDYMELMDENEGTSDETIAFKNHKPKHVYLHAS